MAEIKRYQTPVFRASFVNLFEARAMEAGQTPKYGLSAIWTPSKFTDKEKALWKAIRKAMDDATKAKFGKSMKDMPANFKTGIRDGAEKADLEGYGDGTQFANLTTQMKPGVVDRDKSKIHPDEGNGEDVYPGCYMRATVTVYAYENKGKGVSLGLMNVQKIKDGDRLDSRTDAAEDFDEVEDGWLEEDEDDFG